MADHQIQHRKYLEDSTAEEIKAIEARVSVLQDRIICLREIPVISSYTVNLVFKKLTELAKQYESCVYLVDLTNTGLPDAESRRHINENFKQTLSNVKHVAFVTGRNFIINTAARFVMHQSGMDSFSIHKNIEEALVQIKTVLDE